MEFSFSHLVRNCSDAIKFQEVFVQFCCRSPHGERGLKFNGLIQLFTLVPKAITFTLAAFAYIPPPLVVFATAAISIIAFLHLLGR